MALTTLLNGKSVVILNPAKVALLLDGPQGPVVRDLFVRGERVKQRAISTCPVGQGATSGNLRDHHVKRLTNSKGHPVMLVGVEKVPYALFVHEGTRPHEIRPKNPGGVLAFQAQDGTPVFARKVNHPGTRPNRWLVRALSAV